MTEPGRAACRRPSGGRNSVVLQKRQRQACLLNRCRRGLPLSSGGERLFSYVAHDALQPGFQFLMRPPGPGNPRTAAFERLNRLGLWRRCDRSAHRPYLRSHTGSIVGELFYLKSEQQPSRMTKQEVVSGAGYSRQRRPFAFRCWVIRIAYRGSIPIKHNHLASHRTISSNWTPASKKNRETPPFC